jgi:perosamine synthetase
MTTYEGGMLITDDDAIHRRALILRDHGRNPGDRMFFNAEVAHKYKMSSMQAALGLAQIERIEELIARKREIFSWYKEALAGTPGITLNSEDEQTRNSYWMVTLILAPSHGMRKERLMELLSNEQIDTRPFFHPLSLLPAYQSCASAQRWRERNQVSYTISPYGINLPSGLNLTRIQVDRVAATVRRILADARR